MPHKIGSRVVPPPHRAWDPDDSVDFHASRLLLLIHLCGKEPGPYIEGERSSRNSTSSSGIQGFLSALTRLSLRPQGRAMHSSQWTHTRSKHR
jgi:hypothetical protein